MTLEAKNECEQAPHAPQCKSQCEHYFVIIDTLESGPQASPIAALRILTR